MSGIDNTAQRWRDDPAGEAALFLADAMSGGPGAPIERQEALGGRQLLNSDRLPTNHGDDAPWLALGFTFGEPGPSDPLFQPATLPEGWKREAGEDPRGSYLVDQHGRQRASIFYKAAFYDRKADMHLISVDWYVTKHVEYDGPLVITDEWATPETVAQALRAGHERALEQAEEWRGFGGGETQAKYVKQYTEAAAQYATALAVLERGGAS